MWFKAGIILLITLVLLHFYIDSHTLPIEADYTFEELAKHHGYQSTSHKVVTDDGYILTVYRLFKHGPRGKPVILMHGLFSSADGFISSYSSKGPAYLLVDAGFDVWLPNARGSVNSREHTSLDVWSAKY